MFLEQISDPAILPSEQPSIFGMWLKKKTIRRQWEHQQFITTGRSM